jgi:ribose transport system permease protein
MVSQRNKATVALRKQGIVLAMILVYLVFAVISPQFRTFDNLVLLFRQIATIAVMGAGMTFAIIGGNFDLSVGSLLSLCAVICISLHDKIGPIPAIIITLIVGLASGAVSGFLCGYLRLNSMIVTLGMMNVLQALAMMYTNGQFVELDDSNAWFAQIGKGSLGPIPISAIIMVIFIIITGLILTRTVYGHHIMAVGSNKEACRYSGINDKMVVLKSFMLSGIATALGAILLCSRGAAAQATLGESYEFDVISGVILGGASLSGGSGSVYKTFVGVMILGILNNGFVILGLPYYVQWIAQCVVILIAVYIDIMSKRKKGA